MKGTRTHLGSMRAMSAAAASSSLTGGTFLSFWYCGPMRTRTAVLPARRVSINHHSQHADPAPPIHSTRLRTLKVVDALAVQDAAADFGTMLSAQELGDGLELGGGLESAFHPKALSSYGDGDDARWLPPSSTSTSKRTAFLRVSAYVWGYELTEHPARTLRRRGVPW